MFGNLINRILGLETDSPGTGRQNPRTASDVVKKAVPHEPIPEKYQRDIEALRQTLLKPVSVLILHFKRLYQSCIEKGDVLTPIPVLSLI